MSWIYAGWFVELLGIAERGWFPYLYADYEVHESHGLALTSPDKREGGSVRPKPTLPPPPARSKIRAENIVTKSRSRPFGRC